MRPSRLVVFSALVAVLAAAGAVYLLTRPGSTSRPSTTATPIRVPDVLGPLSAGAIPAAGDIASRLASRIGDPALGTTSALVVDARTGSQLYARQADAPMAPASTAKLLTAAAALTQLKPTDTLTTGVVRAGSTLYLVGGGDVTLTAHPEPGYPATATLTDLAARTVAAVSSQTPMHLRYDAAGWSGPSLAQGWSSSYLTAGNVSRLSPLEVDEARLAPGATAPRAADSALQAAVAFGKALRRAGLDILGRPQPAPAPASALGVAAVESAPIPALVQRMLTTSDNDLAEALGRVIARHDGQPATFTGAASAVTAAAQHLGVPVAGLHLHDASGLSRDDRVTVRTLVGVLTAALHRSVLAPLLAGLPIAGFTGTLADRFRKGASRAGAGVVRAKTGTLAGVNALAGQVVDADGRLLVFAVLAGRVPLPTAAEQSLDRVAAALAGT